MNWLFIPFDIAKTEAHIWKLARATFWISFMLIRREWIGFGSLVCQNLTEGSPPIDPAIPRELKHPQTSERIRRRWREAWFMDLECWETAWSGWNSTLRSWHWIINLHYIYCLVIILPACIIVTIQRLFFSILARTFSHSRTLKKLSVVISTVH
jgi:hypothetical protein